MILFVFCIRRGNTLVYMPITSVSDIKLRPKGPFHRVIRKVKDVLAVMDQTELKARLHPMEAAMEFMDQLWIPTRGLSVPW